MKKVYSFQLHEEGLRSDGFYTVENFEDAFRMIDLFTKGASHPVSVVFREHEVEHDCDVCSSGSVKKEIRLKWEKSNEKV